MTAAKFVCKIMANKIQIEAQSRALSKAIGKMRRFYSVQFAANRHRSEINGSER